MRLVLGLVVVIAACSSATGNSGNAARGKAAGAAGEAEIEPVSAGAGGAGAESEAAGAGGEQAPARPSGGSGAGGRQPTAGTAAAPSGEAGASVSEPSGGRAGDPPCAEHTFYLDTDHDGFGDPNATATACVTPPGYQDNGDDCDDNNPNARPGQLQWFAEPRADGSYDYDCNGTDELRYPTFSECPELDNSCPPPNYWPDGFKCDYAGMIAPYQQAERGWARYTYSVCSKTSCVDVPVEIPACGVVGRAAKQGLGWDDVAKQYICNPMPHLSDSAISFLSKRTQVCR